MQDHSISLGIAQQLVPLSINIATEIEKRERAQREQQQLVQMVGSVAAGLFSNANLVGIIGSYLGYIENRENHGFLKACSALSIEAWLANHYNGLRYRFHIDPSSIEGITEALNIVESKGRKIENPRVYAIVVDSSSFYGIRSNFNAEYQQVLTRTVNQFHFPNLRGLDFHHDDPAPFLSAFDETQKTKMEYVSLFLNEAPGTIAFLGAFRNVQSITLAFQRIVRAFDLQPLSHCHSLTELDVTEFKERGTPSPQLDFSFMRSHPTLKSLRLSLWFSDQETRTPFLPRGCQCLTELSVKRTTITDESINNLLLPNLTTLDLDGCRKISDLAVTKLDENFPKLVKIKLSETQVTDRALTYLDTHKSIEDITLDNCSNLSAKTMQYLSNRVTNPVYFHGKDQQKIREFEAKLQREAAEQLANAQMDMQ